jgi:hypothetical protein
MRIARKDFSGTSLSKEKMCTGLGMFEICAYNYRSLVEAINRSSN